MALASQVNPEQLTTFVLYVEFVTAASLSVCDQWGPLMEAIGASERVMYYLDKPSAAQIAAGRTLPSWSGKVCSASARLLWSKLELHETNRVTHTLQAVTHVPVSCRTNTSRTMTGQDI